MPSNKVVIVCGAGVSQASGIPTYRDKDVGLWSVNDMKTICTKGNEFTEESLQFYNNFRKMLKDVQPSITHKYIANLQNIYGQDRVQVFTQNIDDLFEKAGCEVNHIHGNANEARCIKCNHIKQIDSLDVDYCACGGRYRNNIVFYGEKGNYTKMIETILDMEKDDIFILMGTSCQAINVDLIARTIDCTKIYVNPVIESEVNVSKYDLIFQKKADDCISILYSIIAKKMFININDQ
jgi:NAD-dependent deacetylase